MHTLMNRANGVFFSSISVLAVMCALTTLTTYFHTSNPIVNHLDLHDLQSLRSYRDHTDRAIITFDLDADLTSIFNWNVKQIFIFITAEYTTPSNVLNQVVIYDEIIRNGEDAKLNYIDHRAKYFLADKSNELRNANITLKFSWDIMPVCGRMFIHSRGEKSFQLPGRYGTSFGKI